jgi:uncharacterized protein with PQ loop repeat
LIWQEFLGFDGGLFITLGIIPQVWRLFTLNNRDISLSFTLLLLLGGACWSVHGISMSLLPVIVWNAILSCLMCVTLYAKVKYGRD